MRLHALCALLREIRDVGPMTVRDMADVLEVPYQTAWHRARVLGGEGVLAPVGHRGAAVLWGLAPAGTPVGRRYVRSAKPDTRSV